MCYFPPFSTSWLHNVPPPAKRKSIRHEIAACKPENVTHQRIWFRFLVLFFCFVFVFTGVEMSSRNFFLQSGGGGAGRIGSRRAHWSNVTSLHWDGQWALEKPAPLLGPPPRINRFFSHLFLASLYCSVQSFFIDFSSVFFLPLCFSCVFVVVAAAVSDTELNWIERHEGGGDIVGGGGRKRIIRKEYEKSDEIPKQCDSFRNSAIESEETIRKKKKPENKKYIVIKSGNNN